MGKGRLKFQSVVEIDESFNTLVRAGHYVLITGAGYVDILIARDFSEKGNVLKSFC